MKCFETVGSVVVGAGVVNQGLPACRRIAVTTCVGKQGLKPVGRVVAAGGVVRKRELTDGRVEAASLMFPVVGGFGLVSNRASDVVANGSAQLVEGEVPGVSTMVDAKGNVIAWLYSQRRCC